MRFRTYTVDPLTASGSGLYTAEEWTIVRATRELAQLWASPTMETYRRILSGPEFETKRVAAGMIAKAFDLSRYRLAADLGRCPYAQSTVLHDRFPDLGFILADYDAGTNALLRKIAGFTSDSILDVCFKSDTFDRFEGCDVAFMWSADYALTDPALLRLLRWFAQRKVDFFLGTSTATNLPKGIGQHIGHWGRKFGRQPSRFHGWLRTPAHFRWLARESGYRVEAQRALGKYQMFFLRADAVAG